MPPKRKAAARGSSKEDGDGDPPRKSAKNASNSNGHPLEGMWVRLETGGTWVKYTDDEMTVINDAAFKKKQKKFTIPKRPVRLDFVNMVHVNKDKKEEVGVRYCVKWDSDDNWYTWAWENEDGDANGCPPDVVQLLETAQRHGVLPNMVTVEKNTYKIDLSSMTRTDMNTDVTTKISRDRIDVDDTMEDKEKDDDADTKKSKPKQRKGSKSATANGDKQDDDEPLVKSVIIKGKAPVDSLCPLAGKSHVYSAGDDVFDAMLNQTNVQNNNNKYYLVQVLEEDNQRCYHFWSRWGRVGHHGQNKLQSFEGNVDRAIAAFESKFRDKTMNHWRERHQFKKVPGKYDLIKMDYNTEELDKKEEEEKKKKETKPKKPVVSKLHDRVKALIELISNKLTMEETVAEMQYDAKKAPLGKLTKEQVRMGYLALKKIEDCINRNVLSGQELINACNEYYTRIPHDFGRSRPPLIRTREELKREANLLEALGDIQIALKILNEKHDENIHPCDSFYNSLNCKLTLLSSGEEEYDMINEYLQNTHATTHSQYKLHLIDAFKCCREEEEKRFKDVGNHKLLWHGSRLTNWASILQQGLRIAPPEAPVTGYMFGKGIYFADMSSKSANYCYPTRTQNEGLLVLCQVSLGNCNELVDADYNADNLPKGKHSTFGKGSMAPDPQFEKVLPGDIRVPMGKGIPTGVKNPSGYTLNYNEYIVYDVCQVKIRYLLRVKFQFK